MDKTEKETRPVPAIELGYIGIGRMGFNMTERLVEKGYKVTAYDINENSRNKISRLGATAAASPEFLAGVLDAPRLIWLMVPHDTVDALLVDLLPHLEKNDTVIDGGNSNYKDSIRRSLKLKERGVNFLDAGVSGGPEGARNGACIMVGGDKEVFNRYEDLFRDLSVENGFGYMGESGAGHFVKMIHNGIEYGMMQAIAEGFAVLKASQFKLNLSSVTQLYNNGSVVASRLISWLGDAFREFGENLDRVSGSVSQSGEGMWTVEAGKELKVPVPVIESSVRFRKESSEHPSYTGQILSALRNQFGKHPVFK